MVLSSNSSKYYDILELVGEGTSGQVYKATHKPTKELVALKVIKSSENLERSAKDEIHLLKQLSHISSVIPLRESIISPAEGECVLVFPYFEHDLSGLLSENRLSLPQVKCYLRQLLIGLHEMHKCGFMHRDIKAANLLLNNKGQLVIADLGTAVGYTHQTQFSNKVVTLWYRSPELLLGTSSYGPEIDIWSVGCVFIELMTSRNFLPGPNEQQQLEVICKLCGTPNEDTLPGVSQLPNFSMLDNVKTYTRRLEEVLIEQGFGFPPEAVDLLHSMLCLDPKRRITAHEALLSPFFTVEPLPLEPHQMPSYEAVHVLDAARKRERDHKNQAEPLAKRSRQSNHPSHHPSNHHQHHGNHHHHNASSHHHNHHHHHANSNPHYHPPLHSSGHHPHGDHRSPQHSPSARNPHLSPTSHTSPPRYHHSPERYHHSPDRYQHSPDRYQHSPERYQHSPNHSPAYSPRYTSPNRSEWSPQSDYNSPPTSPRYADRTSPTSSRHPPPPSHPHHHTSPSRHSSSHRRGGHPSNNLSSSTSTLRQSTGEHNKNPNNNNNLNHSHSNFPKWKAASDIASSSGNVPPPATPSAAPTAPPPTPHQHQHLSASLSSSSNHSNSSKRVPNFQVHIPTAAFLRGDWNADYASGSAPAPVAKTIPSNTTAGIFFPTPLTSLKMSGSFSDATITQTMPITPIILSPNAPSPGVSSPPTPASPPPPPVAFPISTQSAVSPPTVPVTTPISITPVLSSSSVSAPPSKPNPFLQTPIKRPHNLSCLTQSSNVPTPITTV